jgi:lipid II:glycine glycyltransferase (peptidoglycan interpeptide bridge formation enzyme)
MFIHTGKIVQYHLSACDLSFKRASASKLILDEARLWATNIGARFLHLGGGLGAKEDNLFEFKRGFSSLHHQFSIWRFVVEQKIYETMAEHHKRKMSNEGQSKIKDFFPMYRAPITSSSDESNGGV